MRNTTSRSSSTWTPPSPNMMSGPKEGSWVTPTIASIPSRTICCTATPAISSSRPIARRRCWTAANASRASASDRTSRTTPPTSDLWAMVSESSLIATGKPMRRAADSTWSAVVARA